MLSEKQKEKILEFYYNNFYEFVLDVAHMEEVETQEDTDELDIVQGEVYDYFKSLFA